MQGYLGRSLLRLICGASYASLPHIPVGLIERNIIYNYLILKMGTIFINENLKAGRGVCR